MLSFGKKRKPAGPTASGTTTREATDGTDQLDKPDSLVAGPMVHDPAFFEHDEATPGRGGDQEEEEEEEEEEEQGEGIKGDKEGRRVEAMGGRATSRSISSCSTSSSSHSLVQGEGAVAGGGMGATMRPTSSRPLAPLLLVSTAAKEGGSSPDEAALDGSNSSRPPSPNPTTGPTATMQFADVEEIQEVSSATRSPKTVSFQMDDGSERPSPSSTKSPKGFGSSLASHLSTTLKEISPRRPVSMAVSGQRLAATGHSRTGSSSFFGPGSPRLYGHTTEGEGAHPRATGGGGLETSLRMDDSAFDGLSPNPTRLSTTTKGIPPLLRRYSMDVKDVLTLNTTRLKERKAFEIAVSKFNIKPNSGIDYLVNQGLCRRNPEDVAMFIRRSREELSKKMVGDLVGSADPFGQEVLRLLLQDYDFTGLTLDQALRVLINDIRFPGEAQMIDRILQRFAGRYYQCNREPFATEDCVYILSFSIIMLNTDLHNRNLNPKKKMKLEDFVRNNRGINNGGDLPRELLETLYNAIKSKEMRMKEGDMYESEILTFIAPRMSGWLNKLSEGSLVTQWKKHWFVLTGGCLYYFITPHDQDPRCIIPLDDVTATKGRGKREIKLCSNFGGVIKSVKIVEGRMVQGTHHHYILTTASADERDEWVEALQKESPTQPIELAKYKASPSIVDRRGNSYNGGRSPRGSIFDASSRPLAEGWLRRKSDVNHMWQRRYFMVVPLDRKRPSQTGAGSSTAISHNNNNHPGKLGLYYYTTQEMGNRMVELGVSTEQGVIPLMTVKSIRVAGPTDTRTYSAPSSNATVLELVCEKTMELLSPESESGIQYWLDALHPYIQGGGGGNSTTTTGSPTNNEPSGPIATSTNNRTATTA